MTKQQFERIEAGIRTYRCECGHVGYECGLTEADIIPIAADGSRPIPMSCIRCRSAKQLDAVAIGAAWHLTPEQVRQISEPVRIEMA